MITEPCPACRGNGTVRTQKKLSVKIPAGVDAGARLRLTGEGEEGVNGGPAGDLYVVIYVQPHDFFERDGNTVHCQVPISFPQAALGADIEVPSLYGTRTLSVPRGIQTGDTVSLPGCGIPDVRGGRKGDQIVHIVVKTPTRLSDRQEELLRELAEIEGDETRGKKRWPWAKSK